MALWGILGSSSPDPLISAHTLFLSSLLHDAITRDMVEYKGRVNAYSQEVLRKESQIKELQGRIDTGDGCEYPQSHLLNISLSPSLLATLLAKLPPQPSMPSGRSLPAVAS